MKRILIAGIGNIFFCDDAFGCEVAKELAQRQMPEGVRVTDFGIRSYDLAYAMMEDYDATILIDATPRGNPPGTVCLIQPDLSKFDEPADEIVNAHSMNPVRVLQMVRALGGNPRSLYVIGCEPAVLEPAEGKIGLSEPVQSAIKTAIDMIEKLVTKLRGAPK
jgi:hydrogenase maturation protease